MPSRKKQKIREKINTLKSIQFLSGETKEIQKKLFFLNEFKKAETISIYISRTDEVDTKEIIKHTIKSKKIFVPSIENERPCMRELKTLEELDKKIPFSFEGKKTNPEKIDVVIVPGIAFDMHGRRIGSGRGYYDMFLEKLKGKIPIIALAYDFQIVDKIPEEPHDIRVDKIITEKRVISC